MHVYTFLFTGNNGNKVQKAVTNKSLRAVKEMCSRTGAILISYM